MPTKATSDKHLKIRYNNPRWSPALAESGALQHPETYRLPKSGAGDPFWGFTRTFYFLGEKRGYWKLLRICEPGKTRGITLVPYAEVARFVRRQMEDANT